jgi:hypothetical protein
VSKKPPFVLESFTCEPVGESPATQATISRITKTDGFGLVLPFQPSGETLLLNHNHGVFAISITSFRYVYVYTWAGRII